jgi:hypothetical protein
MIDCLIFSRNRPAQLDLLLQSIERYAPNLYARVRILYRADSRSYAFGYARCEQNHSWALFAEEYNFYRQTRSWIESAQERLISFLVDDDVFYQSAKVSPLERPPISLRAGDYDYPWSLDGCIYWKSSIQERLPSWFGDPTQLEAGIAEYNHYHFQMIYPCLVGIPANRVSTSSGMPHMNVSPESLHERYIKGDRISLDKTLEGVIVNAAHMEIPYRWGSEQA